MREATLISLMLILFACGTTTEQPIEEEVTALTQEEIDIVETIANSIRDSILAEDEKEGLLYTDFDGVIIYKTAAFETENLNEESTYYYPAATFVMVEHKGKRIPLDIERKDECYRYGYHSYLISEGTDYPLWVYGENLYLRSRAKESLNNNMNREEMDFGYKVNNEFYRFDMASHSWDEPNNPDGYTDCSDYGFPFMYQDDNPTVFPMIIGNEVGELGFMFSSTIDGYLLILLGSDGGGGSVADFIELEEGKFQIKLSIGYQEGSEDAILHIIEKDGQFMLTKIEMMGRAY